MPKFSDDARRQLLDDLDAIMEQRAADEAERVDRVKELARDTDAPAPRGTRPPPTRSAPRRRVR